MLRRWALGLGLLGFGCLDAGTPPSGRQLLGGRGQDQVLFVGAGAGQPNRILLTHKETIAAADTVDLRELSTIDDPGPGGAVGSARLLLENFNASNEGCIAGNECGMRVDALGRLYVGHLNPASDETDSLDELVRIDPVTGAERSFGSWLGLALTADGARIAIWLSGEDVTNQTIVSDVAGPDVTLTNVGLPSFVSEDLFFVSSDSHLAHLPRGTTIAPPLAANVVSFLAYPTERGVLMVLQKVDGPGFIVGPPTNSLFDVSTLTETPLPPLAAAAANVTPSPSGRYVSAISLDRDDGTTAVVTLFDRDAGPGASASTSVGASFAGSSAWRPLHDELWFFSGTDLVRWPAGGKPETVGTAEAQFQYQSSARPDTQELDPANPTFTPDGRFRVASPVTSDSRPPVNLRSVGDEAAPPQLLNPSGTSLVGLWPLADGRVLVEAAITDVLRNDIYLVDPAARTSRALASGGHVIATGRDRCLALLHWIVETGSGDLTLIDYATGAATVLAENVPSVAVDTLALDGSPASASSADALAPGTRVAFLVRNRIAAPQDGLWVVELP